MPRTQASNKPGTERYRDERRADPKPKMRGRQWSDFKQPRDLETASRVVGSAADEAPAERPKTRKRTSTRNAKAAKLAKR